MTVLPTSAAIYEITHNIISQGKYTERQSNRLHDKVEMNKKQKMLDQAFFRVFT